MIQRLSLNQLKGHLDFFQTMYDAVRLVDPVQKNVLEYRENERFPADGVCFNYWKDAKLCDNCISIRAYTDQRCYMKLEQAPGAIMMVTALPVENAKSPIVLELLRNATDTMLFGEGVYPEGRFYRDVVVELNDLIIKDELTGLYNRRYVDERLPVDIVRSTYSGLPLSLAFLDIDNLKTVNDRYGHAAGDTIIASIASAMNGCVRADTDWVARYGGDEFIVCLNNTSYEDAEKILARISVKVLETEPARGEGIAGTVSYGIYTMRGEQLTAEALIALADKRMYQAKAQFKNGKA
ncbi:MAG TPA: GGDEF domain-containing protein [Feifaniaceae bacterium]|nr:GGDEF domain-containing protein [Feifaniaceae bacterium]